MRGQLALVAQLDRALPSEGRGHRFDSCRVRQPFQKLSDFRKSDSYFMSRFRGDVPSDLELFGDFLVEYLVEVDGLDVTKNGCDLLHGDVAGCILEVSRGVLGAACRLLMEAVTTMTLDGRSRLIVDDLAIATDNAFLRAGLHDRNPFRQGLGTLRDYDAEEAAVRLAHAAA